MASSNSLRLALAAVGLALGGCAGAPGHEIAVAPAPEPVRWLRLRLVVQVVREEPGGRLPFGGDEPGVRRVVRDQLAGVEGILSACRLTLGPLEEVPVRIVDPPSAGWMTVGGGLGLPASGDGTFAALVDGRPVGPWPLAAGVAPVETARLIADRLAGLGFVVEAVPLPRVAGAASPGVDLLVRTADGRFARIAPLPDRPLSTDRLLAVTTGGLDLADGLDVYDADEVPVGTPEERILVETLAPDRRERITVFLVRAFAGLERQGESFVQATGSALAGAILVEASGLERARQSFALAHEIGHVLLDDAGHPDLRGDLRPELLMSSFSSSDLDGPTRLEAADCERMRERGAPWLASSP